MSTQPTERDSRDGAVSASDRAYTIVKERIITGEYAGGTLISEGDVASAAEISRTPVREAFLRLEAEGLLRLYPKRGALIVPVSPEEVRDVLEARALVEQHAIRRVVELGTHAEVTATMRGLLEEQSARNACGDTDQFADLDRRFHTTLVEAAGNQLLALFYGGLRDRQLRMYASALRHTPRRAESILAEHAELCSAIEAGDPEGACATLEAHLTGTRHALQGR